MSSTTALSSENLGPALLAVAWAFAAFSAIVIAFRIYVRLKITNRFQIDDWLILFTFALCLGNSVFCTVSVHWGLGRHIQFLDDEQIKVSIKYVYLCEFFSIMAPCFGRISYALLLLQLVPPSKWPKRLLWSIISIQFVVDLGTVIVSFAQCQPIYEFWGPNTKAHCWNPKVQQYTGYFQGSVCSFVDLVLAGFPASLFWNLNMKLSTKISLSVLMGLGVFAMVCSIKKTISLSAIGEKGDPTYSMCDLAIWWTLEAYMVLLAASIPTLRPLIKGVHLNKSRGDSSGERGTAYALRHAKNNTVGSYPKRSSYPQHGKIEEDLEILHDGPQEWTSEERLNVSVGRGSVHHEEDVTEGINKTTTVTVS